MELRVVTPADTADLRREVLRGGRPVALPGDDQPAHHVGVYAGGLLVACGNVRPEDCEWAPAPGWRVRGMATAPTHRGGGLGGAVLEALLAHARERGGTSAWCHARTGAQVFYERAGLTAHGDPWVDPEIGPHVRMWRAL